MKALHLKKTYLKAAIVMVVALAFLMPSSTAFTTKTTTSSAAIAAQPASVKFQKVASDTPLGRGTDVLAAGDAGDEMTPAIVKDAAGNLWIFYVLDDGVDPNVYLRESTDGGLTWSGAWYVVMDGVQSTPVATVDATGMLWVAFIDEGTDTQLFLEGVDPSTDPTTWSWMEFTPSASQVYNHNMGGIATYQTDRTIMAMTYIVDIVYPPYSVPSAAVVTHNGAGAGSYTYTWDSTWNGSAAQHSDIAATNTLFFFAFEYTNSTVGKQIINVRWGDAVAQNDMELWKTEWGMWETANTANCINPAVGASGLNAIVVYQTDAAGNQDLKCSYTLDNGTTWTHDIVVANTASNEVSPRVYMSGMDVYCLFVKDGNLFLVTSETAGATWNAPVQINDVKSATVVSGWHESAVNSINIIWTDSRGTDQDLYFDTGGVPHLLPHLAITEIKGGVGVSATVTNDGDAEATNVVTNIHVTGGILRRINVSKDNTFTGIAIDGTQSIKTGMFFGLGAISITVTATCDEGVSASQTATGKIFFFYVKV